MATVPVQLTLEQLLEGLWQLDTATLESVHSQIGQRLGHGPTGRGAIAEQSANERPATEAPALDLGANSAGSPDIPIVETLLPKSLTIEGDSIRLQP